MERHVLVVLPHPDDEAFGSAGTIAQFTQKGVPVTYACATLGEMGRNMGKPFFANRETLPAIRKKELEEACKILGIKDLRRLGFRDKTLEFEDVEVVADSIFEIIQELNPSLIITHYPGHGVHPDHDACGLATITAVGRLPENERPTLYCHAITKNRLTALGNPDVVNDVIDVVDIKIAAIKAHRSQTEGMISSWENGTPQEPDIMKWVSQEMFWHYKW
ncbi:bacillithiol biosynthesis deacetylase BshB2 [Fictibacillus gelatini]|uniref:bacillithiol biosynthesis deacetylase BshB2 n=1 Tax=Fictibacillus gelatini TaxID=225985 RepID=UPI00040D90C3|nr:bacillithiol biosynthesis deacetylase BshB2 [Fictibacillus gelatini]